MEPQVKRFESPDERRTDSSSEVHCCFRHLPIRPGRLTDTIPPNGCIRPRRSQGSRRRKDHSGTLTVVDGQRHGNIYPRSTWLELVAGLALKPCRRPGSVRATWGWILRPDLPSVAILADTEFSRADARPHVRRVCVFV